VTPRLDATACVQLTLFVLVTGLLLFVVRTSRTQARWTEQQTLLATEEFRGGLTELRDAIALYHLTEHTWPGLGGERDVATALAGFLGNELPRNPWNGARSIHTLAPHALWPADGDARSGWIYRPTTGEVRANVPVDLVLGGVRIYDL
jgi:hypothetical protein